MLGDLSRWAQVCDGWRALDRPDVSVAVERLAPLRYEDAPLQQRAPKVFYVLGGELRLQVEDEDFILPAGAVFEVAQPYRVWNQSPQEARFVTVSAKTL